MLKSHAEYLDKKYELIRNKQCHCLVSSASHWVADKDFFKALKKHKEWASRNTEAIVFFVPLSVDAHYKINEYQPQVNGCENIAIINY